MVSCAGFEYALPHPALSHLHNMPVSWRLCVLTLPCGLLPPLVCGALLLGDSWDCAVDRRQVPEFAAYLASPSHLTRGDARF